MSTFHIYQAKWNKTNPQLYRVINFEKMFGTSGTIVADEKLDAVLTFVKSNPNHRIIRTVVKEFALTSLNRDYTGITLDTFLFAYESSTSYEDAKQDIEWLLTRYYNENWGDKPAIKKAILNPPNVDHVTLKLMQSALPMHGGDRCPKCGDAGYKVRTAWLCQKHGIIGGF